MFWKIYFAFSAILSVVSLAPAVRAGFDTLDFVLAIALIVQQIAVFGYAYRRRIATQAAWQGLFPIFIAALIVSVGAGTSRLIAYGHRPLAAFLLAALVAMIYAPGYVAAFRYAFERSDGHVETRSAAGLTIQWLVALLAGGGTYAAMFGLFAMVWKGIGGDAATAYASGVAWAVALGTLVTAHFMPQAHRALGGVLFFSLSLLFAVSCFMVRWLDNSLDTSTCLGIVATVAGAGFAWFVMRYADGRWAAAPN